VNWLVAASFKLFGVRNEWTARLPSALSVLLVAIAFVTVARATLGARGSIVAAMIWLTNIGIIEKGRLIEIEAFVCLSLRPGDYSLAELLSSNKVALAHVASGICFSRAWSAGKRPDAPRIFLRDCHSGSGLLEDWRVLVHPAHFVGLVVMIGIAAAWAIPFAHVTTSQVAIDKWSGQYTGRLKGIDFKFLDWIQNVPHSLIYFLPWLLLFPFARFSKLPEQHEQRLARALSWGNRSYRFWRSILSPAGSPATACRQ